MRVKENMREKRSVLFLLVAAAKTFFYIFSKLILSPESVIWPLSAKNLSKRISVIIKLFLMRLSNSWRFTSEWRLCLNKDP